jgi:hypothetical protein
MTRADFLWLSLVLIIVCSIIALTPGPRTESHACFAKADGSVYCYDHGRLARLRATTFKVIY